MQGQFDWLIDPFLSENDLIICQASSGEPTVPKPRSAVIVESDGLCSSFLNPILFSL